MEAPNGQITPKMVFEQNEDRDDCKCDISVESSEAGPWLKALHCKYLVQHGKKSGHNGEAAVEYGPGIKASDVFR